MTTNQTHNLGPLQQIPHGEGRVFQVAANEIVVFHDRSGEVYATQPKCPHANGPLADGLMGRGTIVCPLHERTYDLTSGHSTNAECSIRVYPVKLNERAEIILSLHE